jgi:tetratricopeptide (TPR) repeat protein
LEDAGDIEGAITTYEGLGASHKRSDASAEAYYRIGLIYRDHYEQLDEAVESFTTAKEEASRSPAAALANEAIRDIEQLRGFRATIEESERAEEEPVEGSQDEGSPGGSTPVGSSATDGLPAGNSPIDEGGASVEEAYRPEGAVDDTLAHLTLIPSPDVDTAGADSVALAGSRSDTITAPAVEQSLNDSTPAGADTAGASGVNTGAEPGDTTGLQAAAPGVSSEETSEPVQEPLDEVAVARFRMAELYLFRFDDAERAMAHYESVIEKHPDSPLAPKAALAVAWILETRLDDRQGARAAYRSVVADYPDSDFAAAALDALERMDASEVD